jgi:nicotinate-nucleotide--dimethylbenzimidazole phosphoribosyltransferase
MRLEETIEQITPIDCGLENAAQRRLDELTKPPGSLGKLEMLARRIAVIQRNVPPRLGRKLLFVFAADHGVAAEGVSAYPKEVTAQMTRNFLDGGAAINVLARHCGVDTEIVDAGVDHDFGLVPRLRAGKIRRGTANFTRAPAMTRAEATAAVELGIRCVRETGPGNLFLLGAGDMGIGNTTSAAAILCALTGAAPADAVGRGTGIDDATLARKVSAIGRAIEINRPNADDPLDVLSKVGGLEIGAMTGVMLAAAALRVPMVLDGFIAGAAALLAMRFSPHVKDVLFAAHLSAENGHRLMLGALQLEPMLDLQMRLGEGTGACLLMGLMEAAVKIMAQMATFQSAGVGERLS